MKLKAFIEWKGDDHCAELFGVKLRTIGSWRRGERMPRPQKANEIVQLTKGKVQLEDIFVPESEGHDRRRGERRNYVPDGA